MNVSPARSEREGMGRAKIFLPGGRDNPLKRLISDKGIQGNPSLILGKIWLERGPALLDLAKFGFGLDAVIRKLNM
jgi:hypothetical protein